MAGWLDDWMKMDGNDGEVALEMPRYNVERTSRRQPPYRPGPVYPAPAYSARPYGRRRRRPLAATGAVSPYAAHPSPENLGHSFLSQRPVLRAIVTLLVAVALLALPVWLMLNLAKTSTLIHGGGTSEALAGKAAAASPNVVTPGGAGRRVVTPGVIRSTPAASTAASSTLTTFGAAATTTTTTTTTPTPVSLTATAPALAQEVAPRFGAGAGAGAGAGENGALANWNWFGALLVAGVAVVGLAFVLLKFYQSYSKILLKRREESLVRDQNGNVLALDLRRGGQLYRYFPDTGELYRFGKDGHCERVREPGLLLAAKREERELNSLATPTPATARAGYNGGATLAPLPTAPYAAAATNNLSQAGQLAPGEALKMALMVARSQPAGLAGQPPFYPYAPAYPYVPIPGPEGAASYRGGGGEEMRNYILNPALDPQVSLYGLLLEQGWDSLAPQLLPAPEVGPSSDQ